MNTITIGELLRAARQAKRLTLQEVADAAGIDRVQLTQLETGARQDTRTKTLRKLCPVLDTPQFRGALTAYLFELSNGRKKSRKKAV